MTIAQALKKYHKIEADLLLGHVLKQSKEFLYIHPDQKLTAKQTLSFKNMAGKRNKGVPAAYLLGYKGFYNLEFKVNRHVLIPRPESEWLVDEALLILRDKFKANKSKPIRVIDVGTGSGCIAISLANSLSSETLKKVRIFATDISESALKVAKTNASFHKVKINFSKRNLLSGKSEKYDLIIANLPYVPLSDYVRLSQGLKYEPKSAITDGTDEFILIRKLLTQAKTKLAKRGVMFIETDPSSIKLLKSDIKTLFPKLRVQIEKDIHGLERFIEIA